MWGVILNSITAIQVDLDKLFTLRFKFTISDTMLMLPTLRIIKKSKYIAYESIMHNAFEVEDLDDC